jgi:HD-GYP domain-containing protein (c-di-GMP phosphodiesterase class II)
VDFLDLSISLGYATKNTVGENFNDILKTAEDMMFSEKLLESRSMKSRTLNIILRTLYERSSAECRHAENVSTLCALIGRAMGLTDSLVADLKILGFVHDIGKIGINQDIIVKAGKLNADEWYEVKRHSEIGYHIISSSNEMANIALYVLAHHERIDGKGYPKGLKGGEIPLLSRILTISEVFDTMVTESSYKKAMTKDEAVKELLAGTGKQFDKEIVRIFIEKVINLPGFDNMIKTSSDN